MHRIRYFPIFTILLFIFVISGDTPAVFGSNEPNPVGGNAQEIEKLNDSIEAKRKRIKEIEKSIQEYKKKIDKKRAEAVSLSNQIYIIDNRIAQVELDIQSTNEKIESLQLEIEVLELNIADKEESIKKQKTILGELIRNIHIHGDRSFIEILAVYDTFSDFYNELQQLEILEQDLGAAAKSLGIAKNELQEKRDQTEERKTSYTKLNEQLIERKKDLDEQTFGKQELLVQAESSELKFETLVKSLRRQYEDIEAEISNIEKEVRRKLQSENKISNTKEETKLSWPTQSKYVTATFHDPDYPYRHIFEHNAIDIRSGQGSPIKAAASGYVARARKCTTWRCYSYIMLVHNDGISTVYGHMNVIHVSEGQFVTRGDVIGRSGGTPRTVGAGPFVTGPHLHFEVRKNGIPVNPLNYL